MERSVVSWRKFHDSDIFVSFLSLRRSAPQLGCYQEETARSCLETFKPENKVVWALNVLEKEDNPGKAIEQIRRDMPPTQA